MRLVDELNFLANLPMALAERLAAAPNGASPPLVIVYLSSLKVRAGNRLNGSYLCCAGRALPLLLPLLGMSATLSFVTKAVQ